jgi:hypothetical protein
MDVDEQFGHLNESTRGLLKAAFFKEEMTRKVMEDFGIDSAVHSLAMKEAIHRGEIDIDALDAAIGSGEKISELFKNTASYHWVEEFKTAQDRKREENRPHPQWPRWWPWRTKQEQEMER